eukprot:Gb_06474 [translate_table: standard]
MSTAKQASQCLHNPLAMICVPIKQESPLQKSERNTQGQSASKSIAEEPNSSEISIAAQPLAVLPPASRPPPVSNPGPPCAENGSHETETEDDKKREREHKKRSKNWTRMETLKLIRLRTELEPRFARSGRKSELWDEIAESLQRESISRDAQQCRDKWEKLTAGYKEVRDGLRDREDNPFFEELDPLLSGKAQRKERNEQKEIAKETVIVNEQAAINRDSDNHMNKENFLTEDEETEEGSPARKRRKGPAKYITATDLDAVRELLESLVSRQQRFFTDLLDSMERKEQIREQIRQEKEEKWRAEERAQRCVFNNAMIVLTKKLMDETKASGGLGLGGVEGMGFEPGSAQRQQVGVIGGVGMGAGGGGGGVPKKRSKNWKRAEVLQLIKFRAEMETRFAKSTRRAALWDELAELLGKEGIKRDGKQCREKWDKLMAEYKDVSDGKRDRGESPYFAELTAIVGRSAEAG